MALQTSGTISLNDVRAELDATGGISLGGTAVRDLAGIASGVISLSDLYGAASEYLFATGSVTIGSGTLFNEAFMGYANGGKNDDIGVVSYTPTTSGDGSSELDMLAAKTAEDGTPYPGKITIDVSTTSGVVGSSINAPSNVRLAINGSSFYFNGDASFTEFIEWFQTGTSTDYTTFWNFMEARQGQTHSFELYGS